MDFFSCHSLKHINVAMVTVLKNVTNVITAIGETYFFMKHHDRKVWTALILMVRPCQVQNRLSIQFKQNNIFIYIYIYFSGMK